MTFRSPIFRKLLGNAFLLIATCLVVLDFYLTRYLARRQVETLFRSLGVEAQILAGELGSIPRGRIEGWSSDAGARAQTRVTVIDPRGVVLADSQHDPETMENHANRPEIRQAYAGKVGTSIRHSVTLNRNLCYLAMPVSYGGQPGYVLRLAVPIEDLDAEIARVRWRIVEASMAAALVGLGIAYLFSRSFTKRISRLRRFAEGLVESRPSESPLLAGDDELGALGRSLNQTAAELRKLLDRLSVESARREAPSGPGALAILHDITDLERLERVRKDFVANVSHELRTPLTAIRGYAETLLEGALEDKHNNRRFVEIIKAHAIRLSNIASDLLVLSELESGRPPAEPERVSVRAAVLSALRTVESEARVREVTLVAGRLDDAEVKGDKVRLEQALVNLLDNAVKFNRPGGKVSVETSRTTDGQARIAIVDTGIGIPSGDLSRIFERFYRVDKARSREVGGTGLGLSIVKHVVDRMGGKIDVESALGRGSTFTMRLPLA